MKVLIVSSEPTHPISAGNRKMIMAYANLLNNMGHEVYLLVAHNTPLNKKDKVCMKKDVAQTASFWGDRMFEYKMSTIENLKYALYYKIRRFSNWKVDDQFPNGLIKFTNDLQKKHDFDICIINYVFMSKLAKYINIPKIAIFTHDYFSFKSLHTGIKRVKSLLPNEEAKALQRFEHIFAMQSDEAAFFKALSPKSKIYVNYCNYTAIKQPLTYNHNIIMLSGDNVFNINGLKWFLQNIFPLVTRRWPDAKLILGGKICNSNLPELENDSIIKAGLIDNVDDFYSQGDIAINPTYQGTGLKIKTFESMAYGKVVLAHPHSTTGIFKKDSAPLFATEEPDKWISFLEKIWGDKSALENMQKEVYYYIDEMNNYIENQYKSFLEA